MPEFMDQYLRVDKIQTSIFSIAMNETGMKSIGEKQEMLRKFKRALYLHNTALIAETSD